MNEGSCFAHRRRSSVHDYSFPAVNAIGNQICKNYGKNKGQDVTSEFSKHRDRRRNSIVLDINVYNIKDHSFQVKSGVELDNDIDNKLTKRRKSLVLGSTVAKVQIPKSTPTLLEQSQTFKGLRKQISNRLQVPVVEKAEADLKTRSKCSDPNKSAITTKDNSKTPSKSPPGSTVFLKSRGIHVHVIPSPKEVIRQEIVERNSPEKRLAEINAETQLLVTGVPSNNTNEEDNRRSEISSYAIRQQYGQHLEKNWFKSLVREMHSKSKDSNPDVECHFNPEMFYSPEPETDSESDEDKFPEQINFKIESCRSRRDSDFGNLVSAATKFASMDVMLSDGESQDESDIELVLKNGTLIEKRVKDKMYKKRERRLLWFQQFMNNAESEDDVDSVVMDIANMSDKELRAMRLKLKKRTWKTKLKGIERFRQLVRNIQIVLYFCRKLKTIRRQRRDHKRKTLRHRNLVGFNSEDDDFDQFQSNMKRYTCLKERFLEEMGWKLIEDVSNLCIKDGFGYDRREELASGERCSRFTLVLHDLFHFEHNDNDINDEILFIDSHINKTVATTSSALKRSPSCPELIKSKEFRVLFNDSSNEKRTIKTKLNGSSKSKKGVTKSKKGSSLSGKRTGFEFGVEKVEGAIGHLRFKRRNSLTMDDAPRKLDLRELLKDVHIPAKEIKIQIAERKMRKQKTKKSRVGLSRRGRPRDAKDRIEADRFKIPEYDLLDLDLESNKIPNDSWKGQTPEEEKTEQENELQRHSGFSIRKCTYVNSGISWNKARSTEKEIWSNEELDKEIANVGSLFLEMRHCRYIRWNPLRQAIVDRMYKLETEALQSKNKDK